MIESARCPYIHVVPPNGERCTYIFAIINLFSFMLISPGKKGKLKKILDFSLAPISTVPFFLTGMRIFVKIHQNVTETVKIVLLIFF